MNSRIFENHAVRVFLFAYINDNVAIAVYRGSPQLTLSMKKTTERFFNTEQVLEKSVTQQHCPIQDYFHPDDHVQPYVSLQH